MRPAAADGAPIRLHRRCGLLAYFTCSRLTYSVTARIRAWT
jgi:hypothetical protein